MTETTLTNFQIETEALCASVGEPGRTLEAAADKRSDLRFFAVRVPILRKLLKDHFIYEDKAPFEWLTCWSYVIQNSEFYEPISLGLLFHQSPSRTYVRDFIHEVSAWAPRMENWGHCDLLGGVLASTSTHSWHSVQPYMREWSQSDNVWLRRLSIVGLVRYVGKSSTFLPFDTALEFLEPHIDSRDKYISRPVGWVLREYLRADPSGRPRDFIRQNWSHIAGTAKSKLKLFEKLEANK